MPYKDADHYQNRGPVPVSPAKRLRVGFPVTDQLLKAFEKAYTFAAISPDTTQVGATVYLPGTEIMQAGYNKFPEGVQYLNRRKASPEKYFYMEHAERSAIENFERSTGKHPEVSQNAILVGTWAACHICALRIIQSGIRTVVVHQENAEFAEKVMGESGSSDWIASINAAYDMFDEVGIKYYGVSVNLTEKFPNIPTIKIRNQVFVP